MTAGELFAAPEVVSRPAADGCLLLSSAQPLGPYPVTVIHSLRDWAARDPGAPLVAERAADGAWRSCSYGEAVAAAIRLKPQSQAGPEDMIAWCGGSLAKFKVPKHVRFVQDFPMTASGKIQKYKLREDHEGKLKVKT